MASALDKTPQVNIIGKIAGAQNFDSDTLFCKFSFKSGENWTLIEGVEQGDTFQSKASHTKFVPFEHPFDMNFTTQSVRGWPKIQVEVWSVDISGRNSIAGYGIAGLPIGPGEYKLWVPCWRPKADFFDRLVGTYPELVHPEILVTPENKYGLKTESTGKVLIEVQIVTKDFHLHGVKLQDKDEEATSKKLFN